MNNEMTAYVNLSLHRFVSVQLATTKLQNSFGFGSISFSFVSILLIW